MSDSVVRWILLGSRIYLVDSFIGVGTHDSGGPGGPEATEDHERWSISVS